MAEGVVIDEEELLHWPPKRRSIGSNNDTPRRNSIAGLERSVDGKRDAKDAKSRRLDEEPEVGVSPGGTNGDGEGDGNVKGSGDATGTPVLSGAIFV
jgi:hypothetical protein